MGDQNRRQGPSKANMLAGLAAGTLVAGGYVSYWRNLANHQRSLIVNSRMIGTTVGPIEYAEKGEGVSVLMIHGAGGGYDQGILLGRYLGEDVRLIAPSRFGYLRTPLPADSSPSAQAKAHSHY